MQFLAGGIDLENKPGEKEIWSILETHFSKINCQGVCGYRRPSIGIKDKADIPTIILISESHGLILINVVDDKIINTDEAGEYWSLNNGNSIYSPDLVLEKYKRQLETRLKEDISLYDRRNDKLILPVVRMLIGLRNHDSELTSINDGVGIFAERFFGSDDYEKNLIHYLEQNRFEENVELNVLDRIISLTESTHMLSKKKKGPPLTHLTTNQDFIQKSLEYTYKLDEIQRTVAMQLPDGPQRIRGLAGTGKTVILCLKAALTHKEFSDFKILFVFNTQSMYSQIKKYISDYYIYEAQEEPNFENLHILHAWGGKTQEGFYSKFCDEYNYKAKTYRDVSIWDDPLDAIFSDLLKNAGSQMKPYYDMVLIDEAQDFPPSFFQFIYNVTRDPKRIIWAYDEFQSLKDLRIPEPETLFGLAPDGNPNMVNSMLEGEYSGGVEKDFILPNCYRNPRISIMLAHGLALGLYRKGGVIDILENRKSWQAIGYNVISPNDHDVYKEGETIIIERPEESNRNILGRLLKDNSKNESILVQFKNFENSDEEIEYVSKEIAYLIHDENIKPEEIIVVTLDTKNSKNHLLALRTELDEMEIKAITPGFIERTSVFGKPNNVTLTTPFRAKGNEGNIVFVMNSHRAVNDLTFRARNALFVAITRSRGWCYISSHSESGVELQKEIEAILAKYPKFEFKYPSEKELARRRMILSKEDTKIVKQQEVLERILLENPELLIERVKSDPELLELLMHQGKDDASD